MTDPVAEAAAQLAATPNLIDEIKEGIHTLEEKVEHFIHPDAPAATQAGDAGTADLPNAAPTPLAGAATDASTLERDDLPNAGASRAGSSSENGAASSAQNASAAADTAANASNAGANEHSHTSLLRGLVAMLRRKWNVFDSELEALLKDAESHL